MDNNKLIFTAGSQLGRVRFFMWFCVAVFLFCIYFGYDLLLHYGINPGDGGVLRPFGERLAWGVSVFLFGAFLVVAMDIYGRNYISRVFYDEKPRCIDIETLRWWGRSTRTFAQSDVIRSSYHHGNLMTDSHHVRAPWYYVRFKNKRLAYILDAQGEFPDFKLVARLLGL